jgi:hypothetical protein
MAGPSSPSWGPHIAALSDALGHLVGFADARGGGLLVETRFVRLRKAIALGDVVTGWRACWLGGWDKGRIYFVVMVKRTSPKWG